MSTIPVDWILTAIVGGAIVAVGLWSLSGTPKVCKITTPLTTAVLPFENWYSE